MRRSPHPNHTPTHHTNAMGERATQRRRADGRRTDTQADTQRQSPRQGTTDHHVIVSRREEDAALRKCPLPWSFCARCILETQTKVGSTAGKAPALRTNPKIVEASTAPKPHTHPSHPQTHRPSTPSSYLGSTSSSILPDHSCLLLLIDKARTKDKTYI